MPSIGVVLTILAVLAAIYMLHESFMLWRGTTRKRRFWVQFKPDDPLLLKAVDRARETLHVFDALREKYPRYSSLALGPIQEDGDTLPVLVCRKVPEGYVVQRARNQKEGYATPEGEEFTATPADIVDWIVYESEKKDRIYGGYTLRAVVDIAERDGLPIPPHARRQFEKFVDS